MIISDYKLADWFLQCLLRLMTLVMTYCIDTFWYEIERFPFSPSTFWHWYLSLERWLSSLLLISFLYDSTRMSFYSTNYLLKSSTVVIYMFHYLVSYSDRFIMFLLTCLTYCLLPYNSIPLASSSPSSLLILYPFRFSC